jgi:hypothetical protein
VPQTGWTCSKPSPCFYTETFSSGDAKTGNDFGNYRNVTISGMKFKDANANGAKDSGEIGLGGWEIHLFGTGPGGSTVHQQTTTAANGTYSFTVAPGTYTLCEITSGKTGWVQSFPSGTVCSGHTDGGTVTPGPAGYSGSVASGQTVGNRDFGNTPLSTVSVTFNPQADLPDGSDATRATSISCTDPGANNVGSSSNSNTLTTGTVKTNQSSLTCTITFVDP